jgi:hypothetical protein
MSSEQPHEEIPEVEPVEEVHRPKHPCPHCGSENFSRGLALSAAGEVGKLGVQYMATGTLLGVGLIGYEPLHVTLCNDCGTIVRLYVVNKDRKWRHWPR